MSLFPHATVPIKITPPLYVAPISDLETNTRSKQLSINIIQLCSVKMALILVFKNAFQNTNNFELEVPFSSSKM